MENCVQKRKTKNQLEEYLSSYFNQEISLVEDTNEFDEDYRFSFYIEDEVVGEVLFDIWYLLSRKSDKLYITEVGYDFTCVGSYF